MLGSSFFFSFQVTLIVFTSDADYRQSKQITICSFLSNETVPIWQCLLYHKYVDTEQNTRFFRLCLQTFHKSPIWHGSIMPESCHITICPSSALKSIPSAKTHTRSNKHFVKDTSKDTHKFLIQVSDSVCNSSLSYPLTVHRSAL